MRKLTDKEMGHLSRFWENALVDQNRYYQNVGYDIFRVEEDLYEKFKANGNFCQKQCGSFYIAILGCHYKQFDRVDFQCSECEKRNTFIIETISYPEVKVFLDKARCIHCTKTYQGSYKGKLVPETLDCLDSAAFDSETIFCFDCFECWDLDVFDCFIDKCPKCGSKDLEYSHIHDN